MSLPTGDGYFWTKELSFAKALKDCEWVVVEIVNGVVWFPGSGGPVALRELDPNRPFVQIYPPRCRYGEASGPLFRCPFSAVDEVHCEDHQGQHI